MSEKKSYIRRLREKQKASKASFILVTILRLLVILSAVRHKYCSVLSLTPNIFPPSCSLPTLLLIRLF